MASLKLLNPELLKFVDEKISELIKSNKLEVVENGEVFDNGLHVASYIIDCFLEKEFVIDDYYGGDKHNSYKDVDSLYKSIIEDIRTYVAETE